MCIDMPKGNRNSEKGFYNINKHLYFFFIALYGGGPSIVKNENWHHIEPHFYPMATSPSSVQEY